MVVKNQSARRSRLLAGAAWAVTLVAGGAAHAQTTDTQTEEQDIITVTGSRTITDGFSAPSPLTVIGAEQYDLRGGSDVAVILNELPAFTSSITPEATGINLINGGANVIELRGLGAQRALTLVNGRRFVFGASRDLAVDLNALPTALIDRVEVVTGGASAVYGSDAVSGVVNIIYDEDYEGVRATAQYGVSSREDAEQLLLSLAAGTTFAKGRGHVSLGLDYVDSEGTFERDRDFSSRGTTLIPNSADTGPNDGIPAQIVADNVRLFVASPEGVPFTTGGGLFIDPSTGLPAQFSPTGALQPFNPGAVVGTGVTGQSIGGDGVSATFEDFLPQIVPVERFSATGTARFDLSDRLTAFAEATFSQSEAEQLQGSYFDVPGDALIPLNSPAVPPALAGALFAAGEQAFVFGRVYTDLPPIRQTMDRQIYRVAGGFEGELGDSWRWNAYAQFGTTESEAVYPTNRITSNFLAAIGAISPVTLTPLFPCTGECVPLNIFGSGQASQEAIDYVFDRTVVEDATLEQTVLAADIAGDLMQLPAGPLKVAAGIEYREESIDTEVDERVTAGDTFLNPFFPINGELDVTEVFGEANIPLIAGAPLAEDLSVNVAARYTDYSTVGGVTTWKLGSSWAPTDAVRLRGSVSQDIRAPNLRELFQSGGGGVLFVDDPCQTPLAGSNEQVNCDAAGIPPNVPAGLGFNFSNIIGNPDLSEETADTYTIGVVFQPTAVPGLSVSLDWFDIEIQDAIAAVDSQDIIDQCFGSAAFPNAFCGQIERSPLTGEIVSVTSEFQNLDTLETRGLDVEVVYDTPLSRLGLPDTSGDLRLRWIATFLDELVETPGGTGTTPIDRTGEVGNAEVRWNLDATYRNGAFHGFSQIRYIGESAIDNTLTVEDSALREVGAEVYWNLAGGVSFDARGRAFDLTLGVNNVTDNEPPFVPTSDPFFTDASVYDVRGRYYFVRLSAQL